MIIQLESGQKLEIPDGYTPQQIDEVAAHVMKSAPQQVAQQAQPEQKQGFLNNLATDTKNFVKSTAYSVPVGFGDELRDGVAAVTAGALSPDLTVQDAWKMARDETQQEQAQMRQDSPIASTAGDVTGAVLTGAAAAGTKGFASLANSLRSGNPLARIAKGLGTGAVSGAAYGAGTADSGERMRGAVKGAVVGGATGGAIPAVGAAVNGLKSTIAPTIEKATGELAERARNLGIRLRLDQVSPTRVRSTVQKVSQEIPFSGVDNFEAEQVKDFSKALARTIGEEAEDLSPKTINSFLDKNSDAFTRLVGNRPVNVDMADATSIAALRNTVDKTLGITSRDSKILKDEIEAVASQLTDGPIAGQKLAAIRSDILKKSTGATVGKEIFSDILEKLDDITNKSLTPEGAKELAAARRQWRNFKTLEPLLEKSTDGHIKPTELINAVKSSKYIKASRSELGEDDLIDLARIGKQFLVKKGGSDTAQKTALIGGGALGVTAMTNPLAALAALASAGGVAAANRGVQAVNSSQRLVDLAVKNAGKTRANMALPKSATLLPGATGGMAAN